MSAIQYHYETVGRILVHLVNHGLSRIDLGPADAMEIMTERGGDEKKVNSTFVDCLNWMRAEGLIRVEKTRRDRPYFWGVQLTSKGIALIQTDPKDAELGASIEKRITENKGGDLGAPVYGRIGAFVGGALGGFTKAIGG